MLKYLLLLVMVFCRLSGVWSQDQPAPVWTDEQWKKAKEGIEYSEDPKEKEEEKLEDEPKQEEYSEDSYDPETSSGDWGDFFSSSMVKFIGILLLVVLLIVIVYFVMQGGRNIKDKKLLAVMEAFPENLEELPHESDLERFLRLSLEAGDYKTAVRILYINVIQRMHEINWIIWKKDKTNRDYLNEVRGRLSYPQFRDITLAYEIVWYGDTEISQPEFQRLQQIFNHYKTGLNGEREK